MKNLINKAIIENYNQKNNLSKTKFCKICNISPDTYKRILNDENVKLDALFKITRVLEIDLYQIFNITKK